MASAISAFRMPQTYWWPLGGRTAAVNSIGGVSENARVWLVIPTYNESANVEAIVEAALEALPSSRRLLIVDDSSPDGTGEIADRLAGTHEEVAVLHRPEKGGLGPAYVAGFHEAMAGGAELIAQMDADFSHDPHDLPRLLAAAEDADLVLGSRYVDGGGVTEWGPTRRAVSRWGSAYARAALGIGVNDLTGGFKVFHRRGVEADGLGVVGVPGFGGPVGEDFRAHRNGLCGVGVPI